MKKWMTVVFASVFALALSMPAWAQSTTGAKKQTTAAATKADKDAKKEAAKKKKADKKAAAKKAKDDKTAAKPTATKK